MGLPNPELETGGPLEVLDAQTLFPSSSVRHRKSGSLVRLDSGRLLLMFGLSAGPERTNDGVVMLSRSDDSGLTWTDPMPIYAYPSWVCMSMGGLARISDDFIRMILGRIRIDHSLGGGEPFTAWHISASDSHDGGLTWSEPGPEIDLFPFWTEMYGASNPHPLSDGRYMWACMGTMGRDREWHAGVTFSGPPDWDFSPPVIVAQDPERNYSDVDVVQIPDGRYLAVVREHVLHDSVFAHSDDEGKTWSEIRYSGFKGANIKLLRLRSGAIVCAYRNEDPERRGISCSISEDGGETWREFGRLYVPQPGAAHIPSYLCGYPEFVYTSDNEIVCTLHTYPDERGVMDLHLLRLRDRT